MTISYVLDQKLYLNITNQCPNRCDFCIRTTHDGVGDAASLWLEREPTLEEIKGELDARNLCEYRELVFCGFGEPLCRLDVVKEICRYIRGRSPIDIRINTNGLADLIHGRHTARELDTLVDTLSISLNGATPESYQERCHSQFGLDALPGVLRFTKEAVLFIPHVVLTVVDTMPKEEITKCRALCQTTGATFRVREYIP